MSIFDEITQQGYSIIFSYPTPTLSWGKWYLGVKKQDGPQFILYGETEEETINKALERIKQYQK